MDTLITPSHGDHDISRNHSQLVPIEFKSYMKHIIEPYVNLKVENQLE